MSAKDLMSVFKKDVRFIPGDLDAAPGNANKIEIVFSKTKPPTPLFFYWKSLSNQLPFVNIN